MNKEIKKYIKELEDKGFKVIQQKLVLKLFYMGKTETIKIKDIINKGDK